MKIAVIGGGLSGSLVTINLIRQATVPLTIYLFEKSPLQLNKGVAYSSQLPYQLLNVAVKDMSLFLDNPVHFSRWLKQNRYDYKPDDFVPRDIYGKYAAETFARETSEKRNCALNILVSEVTGIEQQGKGYRLLYGQAEKVEVDKVILCTGNFPPGDVPGLPAEVKNSRAYVSHPWGGFNINTIPSEQDILMVGSGLTMIDLVLSLAKHNHKGKITVISRRGLLPLSHGDAPEHKPATKPDLKHATVSSLLKWVKENLKQAETSGKDWRSVINSMREYIPSIWAAMPLEEKKRFMRHLRPFWEIHRHRMPQESINILNEMKRTGRLNMLAGRIKGGRLAGNKAEVGYTCRNSDEIKHVTVDTIINCTGPETEYRKLRSSLYQSLIENKIVQPDALSLGLDANTDGFIINADGTANYNMAVIGPPAKGILWESTALREIRLQAATVAEAMLKAGQPVKK